MRRLTFNDRLAWLSGRERIVLAHMMDGMSAEEIAQCEHVARCTVRTQIRSILQKLGVKSQLAAVARVHREMWQDEDARYEAFEKVVVNG